MAVIWRLTPCYAFLPSLEMSRCVVSCSESEFSQNCMSVYDSNNDNDNDDDDDDARVRHD